jgi:hypothetical protein
VNRLTSRCSGRGLRPAAERQIVRQTAVETWIHGAEEIRPWCELLADVVGYSFDHLDWDAVVAGMANADRHKDLWFEYSIVGPADTIHLRMAYNIWETTSALSGRRRLTFTA